MTEIIKIGGKRFTKELLDELAKVGQLDKRGIVRIRENGKTVAAFGLEWKDEDTLVAHSMLSYKVGSGARVMRSRIEIADRLGKSLYLEIFPFSLKTTDVKMVPQERLVAPYLKQGFVEIGKRNGKVQMLRKPRNFPKVVQE